jgi:uncharacterized cofD-like protein
MANRKIVCLGGGIGTVNLIKGLKNYTDNITVVTSMADDGGSSGRLRRAFGVLPPGDLVSCIAALGSDEFLSKLILYRFPGDRYGEDLSLEGQKLGNLILTAIYKQTNDFTKSIEILKKMFDSVGEFYPATLDPITLSIITKSGQKVTGEEKIELGKYKGEKDIELLRILPENAVANPKVLRSIEKADAIIVGPGDLYSNNIAVLAVKEISAALKKSKAKKFLIINVANKPAETENYTVSDFIDAFKKHIGSFPFDFVLVNNNFSIRIPKKYNYEYVKEFGETKILGFKLKNLDLLDESFPLYHDSSKLAKAISENI